MSVRPRLLDLFCCAGGAAMGYHRAGFEVVGVDKDPQRNYPFEFHEADAIDVLDGNVVGIGVGEFDAIHASPPCQRWAGGFVKDRGKHPDLVEAVRCRLPLDIPFVIENVRGAPLRGAVMLCGGSLGCVTAELQLHRHRYFESNVAIMGVPCSTTRPGTVSVVGNGTPTGNRITLGRNPSIAEKREVMGMDWTTRAELSEAVPPAYTEHIGGYLLGAVRRNQSVAS